MKKVWTEDLDRILIESHGKYTIKKLADILGTTAPSVRARVTRLGLSKRVLWTDSEVQIEETKQKIAQKSRQWNASLTDEQKQVIVEKSMRTRVANGTYAPNRSKTTWKAGWREIGDVKKYYRSRWEANYARYLEWLKSIGQIKSWSHEPKTFWFSGVKRGSVSYLPDFCVVENNGSEAYHEVKGWMDDRSKTKIKRMAKYHPDVKLIVIQEKQYNEIKRKVSSLIPGWE